jgi:hypothetical protein
MQRLHRYLVSFLLGAALIAPVGMQAKKEPNCQTKTSGDTTTATAGSAVVGTTAKTVRITNGWRPSTGPIGNSPG